MDNTPGVFENVPAEVYHKQWQAIGQSTLKVMQRSAAHCHYAMTQSDKDTPALVFGRAFHAAVLEPDVFAREWAVAPECDKRTKAGKELWEAFISTNPGKQIIKQEDYDEVMAMAEAVQNSRCASELLAQCPHRESSFLWRDEETGVWLKARTDARAADLIADLKSTEDAGPLTFSKFGVFKYGYPFQAAMYCDGVMQITGQMPRFVLVAVEKSAPYSVAVYEIPESVRAIGYAQYRECLERYAQCVKTDVWPGYPDQIVPVEAPVWMQQNNEPEQADGDDAPTLLGILRRAIAG